MEESGRERVCQVSAYDMSTIFASIAHYLYPNILCIPRTLLLELDDGIATNYGQMGIDRWNNVSA
jgi:hypothetical protein